MTNRAVLLDLDGTLLDHRRAADEAVRSWTETVAADLTGDAAVDQWRRLERRFFSQFEQGKLSFQEQRRRRVRAFSTSLENVADAEADALFAQYLALYEANWRPYPGARDLIEQALRDSWRVAVLTNGEDSQQRRKLALIGLNHPLVSVFSSSALGFAKPSAQAFLKACAGLNCRPSATVMVGDDYAKDVLGARRAGLSAIHVAHVPEDRQHESVASLQEVLDRLSFGLAAADPSDA